MKRVLLLLCALSLVLTVAACNNETAHKHTYTAAVTTPAGCLTSGVATYSCSCGSSYTQVILPTGHSWGDWECEITAVIGRIGTETRSCTVCSETESRETFEDSLTNAFLDYELQWLMWGDAPGVDNSEHLLTYISQKYESREDETINLASSTVFNYLSLRFSLTDHLKAEMKQDARYNAENDTFTLKYQANFANVVLLGYLHNGGKDYTVYYRLDHYGSDISSIWQIDLVYNILDDKPNQYLSIVPVGDVPSNIITE